MTFPRSVVLLLSVACYVAFAYYVGHGLAIHANAPIAYGFLFLLIGIALTFAQIRFGRARS